MKFPDCRAQLLENIKFLYGSDTSILTLSHNHGYQAVVSRYDNLTKSWIKLLHSKPANAKTRLFAMTHLLHETEKQIVKRLEENEIGVPLLGEQEVVEISLQKGTKGRRKTRANGSFASSDRSGFEFMDTPEESLPEHQEIIVEEVPCELSEKMLPAVDRGFIDGEKVELPPEPEVDECYLVEDEPIHESYDEHFTSPECLLEDPKEEELICEPAAPEKYLEEVKEVEIGPTCESYQYTFTGFQDPWTFWGIPKKNKKEASVENVPALLQSPEPEPELVALLPEPGVDTWGFLSKKNPSEQSAAVDSPQIESEPAPPQPEPEQVSELGSVPKKTKTNEKRGKMKKIKKAIIEEPLESLEPKQAPSKLELEVPASVPKIKKGKKKGKKVKEVLEGNRPAIEGSAAEKCHVAEESSPIKISSPIKEAAAIEECPNFEPISNIHSSTWDTFWKTSKSIPQDIMTTEAPVPEAAIEEPQRQTIAEPITEPILEDFIPSENPVLEILEAPAPLSQEFEEPSLTTTSLFSPPPPKSTTGTIQTPAKKGQIIVLKTLYTNNMSTETLRTILTIPENTLEGIISAANSYLDCKIGPGQRTLRMKYGAGKDGDLDIAAVEDSLWPEYLKYFRLCTRFPELTAEVVQG